MGRIKQIVSCNCRKKKLSETPTTHTSSGNAKQLKNFLIESTGVIKEILSMSQNLDKIT